MTFQGAPLNNGPIATSPQDLALQGHFDNNPRFWHRGQNVSSTGCTGRQPGAPLVPCSQCGEAGKAGAQEAKEWSFLEASAASETSWSQAGFANKTEGAGSPLSPSGSTEPRASPTRQGKDNLRMWPSPSAYLSFNCLERVLGLQG